MSSLKRFVVTLVLALSASVAFAHTHLHKATPADGSVLQTPPKTLTLQFEGEVQLTSVTIGGQGGKPQKVDKLPKEVAKEAVVALPALKPGAYTVNWRAAGSDGHVMSGQLKFTISP